MKYDPHFCSARTTSLDPQSTLAQNSMANLQQQAASLLQVAVNNVRQLLPFQEPCQAPKSICCRRALPFAHLSHGSGVMGAASPRKSTSMDLTGTWVKVREMVEVSWVTKLVITGSSITIRAFVIETHIFKAVRNGLLHHHPDRIGLPMYSRLLMMCR